MPVPNLSRIKYEAKVLNETNSHNVTTNGTVQAPLNDTAPALNNTAATVNQTSKNTQLEKRGRRRPDEGPYRLKKPLRATKALARILSAEERRGACAKGKAFYKCGNGFTGCCAVDPCTNDKGICPDNQNTGGGQTTKTSSTGGQQSTEAPKFQSTSSSSTTSNAASPSQSNSNSPPACPGASNKIFKDSSGITYRISCGSDNTFASTNIIPIDAGGYGGCFGACSNSSKCAGFVFSGSDSGTCALKSQLPRSKYVVKENSNFVSCAKLNPKASVSHPGGSKKPSTGALVGIVIGVLFIVALLAFLAFYLIKKKRKKEVERQTIILNNIQSPMETAQPSIGGHQRQVSTSHDVYGPYGGYHDRSSGDAFLPTRRRSSELVGMHRSTAPASTFWSRDSNQIPIMLDNSPTSGQPQQSPEARPARFQEHLSQSCSDWTGSIYSQRHASDSVISESPTTGRPQLLSRARYEPQNPGYGAPQGSRNPPFTRNEERLNRDSEFKPSGVDSFDMIGERYWR